MTGNFSCSTRNAEAIPTDAIPLITIREFRDSVLSEVSGGSHIAAFFGQPAGKAVRLYAVLARDESGTLALLATEVDDSFPSLTPDCPQAHWFEREIAEQWGVTANRTPMAQANPFSYILPDRQRGLRRSFQSDWRYGLFPGAWS